MNLRTRLTVMFFSIILISLSFMALILYKNSERILTQNTLNHLKVLANLIEARVNDVSVRYREHLLIAANRLALHQALDDFFADKSTQNQEKVKEVLKKFYPVSEGLEDIFVFDVQGNLIAGTSSLWEGQNVLNEQFFKEGLYREYFDFRKRNKNDKYLGELLLSTFIKPQDQIVGVIVVLLRKDFLAEITQSYLKIGETEDVLLGRLKANGDGEFIAPRRFQDDPSALEVIPKNRKDIPMMQALAGHNMVFDNGIDYRGHRVMAVAKYINSFNIGLVIKVDKEEFLKPIKELTKVAVFFGGLIVFFTLFIAFIIARSLSAPIEQLSRSADDVASGDSTVIFSDLNSSNDELGILSRSLNTMAQRLLAANKGLEIDVRERTKELKKRLQELETLNEVAIGRETRMIELKGEINRLSKELGRQEPYDLSFLEEKKDEQ